MLMKQNVNNDVTKDSPILDALRRLYHLSNLVVAACNNAINFVKVESQLCNIARNSFTCN